MMTMSRKIQAQIEVEEAELIRSLTQLAERIDNKTATAAEILIAEKVLCDVNSQIAACPLSSRGQNGQAKVIILPVKKTGKVVGMVLICFILIGCRSTTAHRANHQGSINENEYLQEKFQNDRETMSHLRQQELSLKTTQDWLGQPDDGTDHNSNTIKN